MTRPLSPVAIKDTITAICADPAHRKPLAEDPQIAAKMQDVLRRMVNAAAGNERMGEMTLVALLGHGLRVMSSGRRLNVGSIHRSAKINSGKAIPLCPSSVKIFCEVRQAKKSILWHG